MTKPLSVGIKTIKIGCYYADLTVGSLKIAKSRVIVDLLRGDVGEPEWKQAITTENILMTTKDRGTGILPARLNRQGLETMSQEVWLMINAGTILVGTPSTLAGAVTMALITSDVS